MFRLGRKKKDKDKDKKSSNKATDDEKSLALSASNEDDGDKSASVDDGAAANEAPTKRLSSKSDGRRRSRKHRPESEELVQEVDGLSLRNSGKVKKRRELSRVAAERHIEPREKRVSFRKKTSFNEGSARSSQRNSMRGSMRHSDIMNMEQMGGGGDDGKQTTDNRRGSGNSKRSSKPGGSLRRRTSRHVGFENVEVREYGRRHGGSGAIPEEGAFPLGLDWEVKDVVHRSVDVHERRRKLEGRVSCRSLEPLAPIERRQKLIDLEEGKKPKLSKRQASFRRLGMEAHKIRQDRARSAAGCDCQNGCGRWCKCRRNGDECFYRLCDCNKAKCTNGGQYLIQEQVAAMRVAQREREHAIAVLNGMDEELSFMRGSVSPSFGMPDALALVNSAHSVASNANK